MVGTKILAASCGCLVTGIGAGGLWHELHATILRVEIELTFHSQKVEYQRNVSAGSYIGSLR